MTLPMCICAVLPMSAARRPGHQAAQVHLMKIHREDVGHHYSYMVSRLLLAFGWVCLGLRRQHVTARASRRRSTAADMRSMLGLGAAARAAEVLLGQGKPREVTIIGLSPSPCARTDPPLIRADQEGTLGPASGSA